MVNARSWRRARSFSFDSSRHFNSSRHYNSSRRSTIRLSRIDEENSEYLDDKNSEYLGRVYECVKPGELLTTRRKELVKKVRRLIKSRYPIAKIRTYGSWKSKLSVTGSDIDFTVNFPDDFVCTEHTCQQIAKVLRDRGVEHPTAISGVNVRDMKGRLCIFGTDEDSLTNIDLTLNNRMGPLASKFIGSIVDIDLTVQMFLVLVKYFSKCQKLDDPSRGFLASIGFSYMGIFFLQEKDLVTKFLSRNTIRNLAELVDVVAEAGTFKVNFVSMSKDPRTTNIGKLLREFFQYYSVVHEFDEYAISILGGHLVRKSTLGWEDAEKYSLAILDPFGDQNVGRTVSARGLQKIRYDFAVAHTILLKGSQPHELFESFDPNN